MRPLLSPLTQDRSGPIHYDRVTASPDPRPIVLFFPAHDEEGTVGSVIARSPKQVCGYRVKIVVVDDGSTDSTAAVATRAGADVVVLRRHLGLGAAVRIGLRHAVITHDPIAVAFADADGEYAPEELARLIEPIVAGEADYVIGSRFQGEIGRMLPSRRFGNHALTIALRAIARTPISDGQSGYRALSASAAAHAEIIHDYNYAQVLTLDLLAKGFRYGEVPISYSFRTRGSSFVRPFEYLSKVVPAVVRQIRAPISTRVI
jgi:glycosyltransferase involved in cell wall biosynthesis